MKLTRNYLTSEDLVGAVKALLPIENVVERDIAKIAVVLKFVCEDIDDEDYCDNITDEYFKQLSESDNIVLERDVLNYYLLDRYIQEEKGLEKTVYNFLDELSDKIDKYAEILDTNVLQETLLNGLKEVKEVTNNGVSS